MRPRATGDRHARRRRLWTFGLATALIAQGACDAPPDGTESQPANLASSAGVPGLTAVEQQRLTTYVDSLYARSDVHHAFKTVFGEDIDCVDYLAQPAFKDPSIRALGLPSAPSRPVGRARAPRRATRVSTISDGSLDENGNVRRCPDDTVPIVRVTPARIMRAGGLDRMLAAGRKTFAPPPPGTSAPPASAGYKYVLGVNQSVPAGSFGSDATHAIYNPPITPGSNEHSLSQTWVLSPGTTVFGGCSSKADCVQSLEAGWNVDAGLYGDTSTHFFTFSTKDGYRNTGCYNLIANCGHTGSGFVLDPFAPFTPGQILPSSTAGTANPFEIELSWESGVDASGNRNWYLYENFSDLVGYIPASLFSAGDGGAGAPLVSSYTLLQAGGEIYDSAPGGHDTTADMGSGQFASKGFWQAAYLRNINYENSAATWTAATKLGSAFESNSALYTGSMTAAAAATDWGTYFYYGGPGLTAPAAPKNVKAKASGGKVTISWTSVTLADTYVVRRATKSGGPYTNVKTGITTTSYKDGTVTRGKKYYYVVAAVNSVGTSANSSQVSVTP